MSIWKPGKKNFAGHLLDEIQKTSSVNANGSLQFNSGFGADAFDLLIECIDFTKIFDSMEVYLEKIVLDAIEKVLLSGQVINESTFVNKFNLIKQNEKYQNVDSYQLIVEAYVTTKKNHKIIFNECEIRLLSKNFPRKSFPNEIRKELGNTVFLVTCCSPTSQIARFKALEAINFVRALWYLCTPTGWKIEGLESLIKPNNPIEISHICYYKQVNSNNIIKKQLVNFIKNPNSQYVLKLEESTIQLSKKVLKLLNIINQTNIGYYKLLVNSLIQFVKSLDLMDRTNSIPLLWGAIEQLVKKKSESKYDDFIARCSFLYKNDFFVKNLLELIKEHRNNFVHNGAENDKLAKLYLIELVKIYKDVFSFHLRQAKKNYTFEEAIEILSFPKDIQILKNKIKGMEYALSYMSPDKLTQKKSV